MMDEEFIWQILNKQQQAAAVPSNKIITGWAMQVIRLLYPEQSKQVFISIEELQLEFKK
jgi:serine O-acetyltransferase